MLLIQDQLSISTNKLFYLSKVLICLAEEFKKEMLRWITQNNNFSALAQTQYKVTDQIHGNVCLHALGLWM